MVVWIYILMLILPALLQKDVHKEKRERMVSEQISSRGVRDTDVLNAMRKVPRHLFVPAEQSANGYEDRPLPIGFGQTISQPYIVGYMTEVVRPNAQFKVLEIGTGSGYQAAVLAQIVKEVYTIEIVPQLGQSAANRLKKLGYNNVQVRTGDGYYGWKEHAPYDAIVVTAAAEFVPPPLIEQLKDGGKIIIPVGSPFMTQMLMLIEKKGNKTRSKTLMAVAFVPFTRGE